MHTKEIFEISPTQYSNAKTVSPTKRAALARRTFSRLEKSLIDIYWKLSSGCQCSELLRLVRHCESEQIETPVWIRWHLLLHKAADHAGETTRGTT